MGLQKGAIRETDRGGDELCAPLLHPDRLDLGGYSQALEERQVGREEGLTDVEARMARKR